MLCEVSVFGVTQSFWLVWGVICSLAFVSLMTMSGVVFKWLYVNPTYETWRYKTNPEFPSPEMVRDEIRQTIKSMAAAAVCPALALYMSWHGYSHAYCGTDGGKYGWSYHIGSFLLITIASDFMEFYYHRLGHVYPLFWSQHKAHHLFPNPSPFAVIADEYVDQTARALPLLLFPLVMPVNMDLLFGIYAIFFYAYGVYLHAGYEVPFMGAHQPIFNSSFQHHCHHAKSIMGKPYFTGFFFKCWDNMFGSVYKGECFCAHCEIARGKRTREAFEKVHKPDYSVLLQPSFWLKPKSV